MKRNVFFKSLIALAVAPMAILSSQKRKVGKFRYSEPYWTSINCEDKSISRVDIGDAEFDKLQVQLGKMLRSSHVAIDFTACSPKYREFVLHVCNKLRNPKSLL